MLPNTLTAKYEVLGTLGSGAAGTVLDARDRVIGRRVAVKVINRSAGGDTESDEAFARFRREAQAAGGLVHPNIVAIYEFGEEGAAAWIVMEYVDGGSLKALLDRGERLTPAEAARITTEILNALAYSHDAGVIHRDVKPANILLTSDGRIKLADFGIARVEDSTMTQVGAVMGTPSYMAPEQVRGETTDRRTDIWATGVVLYQLLTGEKPFEGGLASVSHRILNSDPVPPSKLSVQVPSAMDAVVARALSKRPDGRYEHARAFAAAIAAALTPAEEATEVASRPPRDHAAPERSGGRPSRGRPLLLAGCGGAAVAAAIGAFLFFSGGSGPVPQPGPPPVAPATPPRAEAPATQAPAEVAQAPAAEPPAAVGLPPVPPAASPAPLSPPPIAAPPRPAQPAPPFVTQPGGAPSQAAGRPDPRTAIREVLDGLSCGQVQVAEEAGAFRLTGIVPRDSERTLIAALQHRGVDRAALRVDLRNFDGPYCEVLDLLRPFQNADGGGVQVELVGRTPVPKGSLLRLEAHLPPWGTHLAVDYVMSSAQVAHLVRLDAQRPGARFRLGEPNGNFTGWEIDEPLGTDLVVAIASDGPLSSLPRPEVESLTDFMAALSAKLRSAQRDGRRVSVRVLPVDTVAR